MPGTRVLRLGPAGLLAAALAASAAAQADRSVEDGLRLIGSGDYEAAADRLADSSDSRAPALLAVVRAAAGDCGRALQTLLPAAQAGFHPSITKLAGLAAARCAIAERRFPEALSVIARLLTSHPSDPDVLYERARLHLKGWNDAVESMFAASPASFRVNQLSAEILEIQGRYDDAVREYRKAIAKSPSTVNLHYRLGRALLLRSHEPEALKDALQEFEAELRLNPRDAVAEFQVGQILQVLGRGAEALPRFERAVDLDPDFPEALIALARERLRAERFDESIAILERALSLHPASEPAHYALMMAYRNAGRLEDAARVQSDLQELQAPEDGEFSDFLRRIGESP